MGKLGDFIPAESPSVEQHFRVYQFQRRVKILHFTYCLSPAF
jgi:hypothetical protein